MQPDQSGGFIRCRLLKNALRLGLLLLWLGAAGLVRADGKVFPPSAFPGEIRTPDQTALIVWGGGVERLVIETRFAGEGTNFAWVIPLPTEPVIEPATTGLFTTLRFLFQPVIQHNVPKVWAVSLAIGGLCWLLLTVRKSTPPSMTDVLGCAVAGIGFGFAVGPITGLAVAFSYGFVVYRVRGGREPIYSILLATLFIVLVGSMMLPALGAAGGSSASLEGVRVLQQERVGIYETTTVSASDPDSLGRWLEGNGFTLTPGSQPVIEAYVTEGWVFVAAKVHRDSVTNEVSSPHPLSFTFAAEQAVYPMRLTGVGNDEVSVELYVFGPDRASALGFQVTDCQRPLWPSRESWPTSTPRISIRHALLRKWAISAPVATKLTANMTTMAMQQDVTVSWKPFQAKRTTLYSRSGALQTGLNFGVPVATLFIVGITLVLRWRESPLRRAARPITLIGLISSVVVLSVFLWLPKVSVRLVSWPGVRARHALSTLAEVVRSGLAVNERANVSIAEIRSLIERVPRYLEVDDPSNVLLGGTIQEEDSPGNYTLRETEEGIEFLGYDPLGGWEVIDVFSYPSSSPSD